MNEIENAFYMLENLFLELKTRIDNLESKVETQNLALSADLSQMETSLNELTNIAIARFVEFRNDMINYDRKINAILERLSKIEDRL